ncbi:MAG TPA: sugar transferase [Dehalococcoidia bacterium]|nr:sugar transferase [Dehalococcoidia bacterium]
MREPEELRAGAFSPPSSAPRTNGARGMPPEPEPDVPQSYPGIPDRVEPGPTSPFKQLMDITIGGMMIGILWPVFALAAFLIKVESPGPVLIKQDRIGLNGKGFRFLKFRTMHHNRTGSDIAERLPTGDLMNRLLSPRGRPEHATAIGWSLRKTTVDELPQLVNVVRGDMSLVGPRPDMPEIVAAWPDTFRQRHKVKPGMTGLAQINGRSDLTHYEKVRYDLRYVLRHPLAVDLMILAKTMLLVISKKGAR